MSRPAMTAAAWIGVWLLAGGAMRGQVAAAAPAPPTATAPVDSAAAAGPRVTLRWKAREQGMTYGYIVYRSERRAGPFVRRNEAIVRVPDDGGTGVHEYVWVDEAVTAGVTYFYYIDAVGTGGVKERLSGVIEKRVAPAAPAPVPTEPTPSPPGGAR
jgi:hypothetical protein